MYCVNPIKTQIFKEKYLKGFLFHEKMKYEIADVMSSLFCHFLKDFKEISIKKILEIEYGPNN